MRSSVPDADISTPVRTGRVSSRDAERATRAIVCVSASVGKLMREPSSGRGSLGKSSARSTRR